ncbi:MAG TPA: N-6 DNA methylase [Planctomycetaceae bacterium]|nr:N-6 DNA methylase [Planctomycetaceae bacterium]HQZ66311.1 N-6 DNA methylase [Planctomycetaceae bacterium]
MLLEQACNYFGWPSAEVVLRPPGEGAAACKDSAERRIGAALKRKFPEITVEIGILSSTLDTAATVWPQAIVCQFRNGAPAEALQEAHRLAWNFSGSAILIILEPHRLTAWSCCQDPEQPETTRRLCELQDENTTAVDGSEVQRNVRQMLHWVSLVTGDIIRRNPDSFPANGRADRLLLKNLRYVRRELIASGLAADYCHDLLARVIFTQFLFHRKDLSGNPFFSKTLLSRLVTENVLRKPHEDLGSILSSKEDTYSLFLWMDDRFNGDLFPGKEGSDGVKSEAAWKAEKNAVTKQHLKYLSELVSGTIDTTDRQLRLWPQYSFDTIPLEFISSVYEEFLNESRDENKAYYTPPLLVDYVLDAVLPWDGSEWNLRILDPSCGSGIFLVKAFQRLIYRWRRQHDRDPLVSDLKPILANNLVGVDINQDAVRVACFSLYLAMADAIDPRHYVTREKVFPPLRDTRLLRADFFDEALEGIRTDEDAQTFDLVIGNAPWGDKSVKNTSELVEVSTQKTSSTKKKKGPPTKAQAWAKGRWPVANNDIGPLFVAKALELVNATGRVAMVQPAPPWLYQRAQPALDLRKQFFTGYSVDEITNLSAVRRELFNDVIGPACVIVAGTEKPDPNSELYYFAPKPIRISPEATELRIEPQDVSRLTHFAAANDPVVWSALALGGQRDLQLIRRLGKFPTLSKLKESGDVQTRMGVIPGDKKKYLPELKNKPYFEATQFPENVFLKLDASSVPKWQEPLVHSLHGIAGYDEFKNPQLLIKQSYSATSGRFRAAIVHSTDPEWGVVCKETYLAVRDCSKDVRYLNSICIAYNSKIAVYFLFLVSSRLGHYITEVPTHELTTVPLPDQQINLNAVESFDDVDNLASAAFGLNGAESILVDDLLQISLPDAIRQTPGPARQQTERSTDGAVEPQLSAYGQTMSRVLKSTFGRDKSIAFTVYQEDGDQQLPVRMVTLHLDWPDRELLTVEPMSADGLYDRLAEFHQDILSKRVRSATGQGLGFQRVAFFVHSHQVKHNRVQNVTIIKPDEYRYWTRSQAMRDADELAASILTAARRNGTKR